MTEAETNNTVSNGYLTVIHAGQEGTARYDGFGYRPSGKRLAQRHPGAALMKADIRKFTKF